ncbi:hypothetical protein OGATHE_006265 [Ogataea polymorpha]|uniref:Uncharacterized protein n=1 Tax=Ogataea polymorpha TaxID=460523 RepID=A0A9P8NUB4_9ASCO|nr:hypothetical protein OGATHE_006265 [Ogataea polymorpha]
MPNLLPLNSLFWSFARWIDRFWNHSRFSTEGFTATDPGDAWTILRTLASYWSMNFGRFSSVTYKYGIAVFLPVSSRARGTW